MGTNRVLSIFLVFKTKNCFHKHVHNFILSYPTTIVIFYLFLFFRFYVDKIPIRVFENNTRIGVNYPSQAMSIVGSLWSDTTWASHGQPINWTEAPFVAYFQGFNINGCLENININTDHSECNSIKSTHYWWNGPRYMALDHTQTLIYENVRRKHLTYSYCDDRGYLHPECQMKKY